jgi:hypothetical protein
MVDHVDTESPFANPPLMEGYPLDRAEREALERALDELDASAERNSHEAARTAQPPTGAAA